METNCPIESLERAIVFDSRDWCNDKRSAWIYGIIVGWEEESLQECQQKFGWTDEAINRLKLLHEKANKLREEPQK